MTANLLRAYRGEDDYLFVSYAHKDDSDVCPAIEALAAKGYRVWYDEGIEAGDDWAHKIGTSLERSKLVLFFASPNSVKSDNCRRELVYAKEHIIPVLTATMGKFKMPEEFQRLLFVEQMVDLAGFKTYGGFADGIAPVLDKHGVGGGETADIPDRRVVFANKRRGRKTAAIVAVCVVAVLLVGFAAFKALFREVPTVVGLDSDTARSQVEAAEFNVNVSLNYSDEYDYGVVFDQSAEGRTLRFVPVVLTQSLGPEENLTDVPDTVGRHVSDGAKLLVAAGMTKFTIAPEVSAEMEKAYILAQSIPAGLRVSRANVIDLSVATDGGELTFELDGKIVTISGTEAVTIDISALPDAQPEIEPEAEPEVEPEPEPEPTSFTEAVAYLKEQHGDTTLFDSLEDTATWGLLRQSMIELYGLRRSYVYGAPPEWPDESADYFLPGGDPDSDALMTGIAVYAAIKAHDPSIVADWSSVDLEASNIYPGVLVALDTAQRSGIITAEQNRVFPPIGTVGDLALLLANADKAFAAGRISTPPAIASPPAPSNEPAVESELLTALGITGKTAGELKNLTKLEAQRSKTGRAITDTDLGELAERMPNLNDLRLNGQQITDITPLLNLSHLETLDLSDNPVSSVSGLSGLPRLTDLSLNGTNVTVLPQLAGKDNIRLDAGGLEIRDVSALANVNSFDQLLIDSVPISSLLPLLTGKPIRELNWTGIEELSSIGQLAGLRARKLDVCWSWNLTSLEGCEALTATTTLNLKFCHALTDLTPLLNMPNLETLYISSDMSGLASQLDGSGISIQYDNG